MISVREEWNDPCLISFNEKWNDPSCDLLGMNGMIRIVIFVMKLLPIRVIQCKRVT